MKRTPVKSGHSLFEMLLVLALAGALFLGGVSAWHSWRLKAERRLVAQALISALDFAKQAAVARHEQVSLCPAASDVACGQDWSKGFLIFMDPMNHGQPEEGILKRVPAFSSGLAFYWKGWLSRSYIRFAEDGLPHGYQGSFYWASESTPILVMNATGRVRTDAL